jgi:L-lactate transport
MIWHQTYLLFGCGPILSALIAAFPIYVILILLGIMRKPAWVAGVAGLATAALIAVAGYGMPTSIASSAAAFGASFGIFPIAWIVFWAIVLFRITVETGNFEIIRSSIGHLTSDSRLQILLIAFGFGAFIEGAAGFGTPVAIAAAMLVGLGFSPFRASAACLLANTAPGAFGSIGIPIVTLAGTTGLPLNELSATAGRLCVPINALLPVYILLALGGSGALSGIWIPALVTGGVFAGVQFLVAIYLGPQLTDLLASLSAMATVILIARILKPTDCAAARSLGSGKQDESIEWVDQTDVVLPSRPTNRSVFRAWLPYVFLVVCILAWGAKPVQEILNHGTMVIQWPLLHDKVLRMPPVIGEPSPYAAIFTFNLLSASGTSCMVAALLAALAEGMGTVQFLRLLRSVALQLGFPALTFASVLGAAFLMNYSGATSTLGLAFARTGALFPFFSAGLGWLGAFLTGSDTSSNALFGNLQVVTAGKIGISAVLMAATNAVGGMMGKLISLQTIAVAAAATGMSTADQSRLFRFTLKHSIFLASVVGGIALAAAYIIRPG